jgi:acetylornithine deacetylase
MFEAHQDTVPVLGMTIDPFNPEVRDGRIYGRGACDIKGGMAAMLAALARLSDERPSGMPTILMACSVNEENGYTGAMGITQLWEAADSIFPRKPDACVVAEPTLLDVVVAHRGVVRWKCHAHGKAAHSSQPGNGDNAIYKLTRVIQAMERYHNEVTPTLGEHPLCGRPTLCVSTITGGISINTVPDRCTIEIDRRAIPGEDLVRAHDDIIDYVTRESGITEGIEHEAAYRAAAGLNNDNNGALADRLVQAALESESSCHKIGVPYGTDASVFAAAGVPSVVFGPGSIDQAHTVDEWLAIDQLERASEIYYRFGLRGL